MIKRYFVDVEIKIIAKVVVNVDNITLKPGPCGQTLNILSVATAPTTPELQSESEWDCNFETERCNWFPNGNPPGWNKSSWLIS